MNIPFGFIAGLFILLITLYLLYYLKKRKLERLEDKYFTLERQYQSMHVKHGNQFESFVPFMDVYPGKKENSVFLGRPVDFISFDDDSIKFIEVKTGKSGLNDKQKHLKELIEQKKVEWHELRFEK